MNRYYPNSIIFSTAFQSINRDNWSSFNRKIEEYINYFLSLSQNILYKLIVYLDDNMFDVISKYDLKSNIVLYKISHVKTFYNDFIENERIMINSKEYKRKLVPHRLNNPEHWSAEYNFVNHNKINYVSHTKKLYPIYEYYAWIDFGCIRNNINDIPKNINFKKLHKKISYLALNKIPNEKISAEDMLKRDDIYFAGAQFIIHTTLVETYEKLYRNLLETWKKEIICDDDQNAILQIYFDNKNLFELFYSNEWISLFRNHLNSNIELNNRYDIHKLINSSNFSGSFVEIGVGEGIFSKYILENTSLSQLILIDPYTNFTFPNFLDSMNSLDMEKLFKKAIDNLFNYRDRIIFIRNTSSNAVLDINDNSLDVVYIDGNHAYEYVLEDLNNYWPKLRPGGIMFGNAVYENSVNKNVLKIWDGLPIEKSKSWGVYGVRSALNDFCKENNLNYTIFAEQFMIYKA